MLCMSTYAERLARAMSVRGMSPHTDQSELARRVGMGCKPQNIQHLLDPNKNAKSSKYTARIAEVLNVDPQWLAYETGTMDAGQPKLFTAIEEMELVLNNAGQFETAQRQVAQAILAKLSGARLTKALAHLQDLAAEGVTEKADDPDRGFEISGGTPDPIEMPAKRRGHR